MQRHPDLLLAGDHVVIGDDMPLESHDHPGPLPLRWVVADPRPPPDVQQPLGADPRRVDAHHRWDHRLGQPRILAIQPREQIHITQIERRLVRQVVGIRAEFSGLFGENRQQVA